MGKGKGKGVGSNTKKLPTDFQILFPPNPKDNQLITSQIRNFQVPTVLSRDDGFTLPNSMIFYFNKSRWVSFFSGEDRGYGMARRGAKGNKPNAIVYLIIYLHLYIILHSFNLPLEDIDTSKFNIRTCRRRPD